jgi:hypothetical protein
MKAGYTPFQIRKMAAGMRKDGKVMRTILAAEFGPAFADGVIAASLSGFAGLIPVLPFIGGRANPMTSELVESAKLLAFYRCMRQDGVPDERTCVLVARAMQARLARYPRFVLRLAGRMQTSRLFTARLKRLAASSQRREYPGNFVFTVVDGGVEFDWGIDFTQCSIHEFYKSQQAEGLMRFICPNDFISSRAFGFGLTRTKTLPEGHGVCDQRVKRNGTLLIRRPVSTC